MNENTLSSKLNRVDTSLVQMRSNLELDANENIEDIVSYVGNGKYQPRQVSFAYYTGTELNNEMAKLDTSLLTSAKEMFNECTNLTTLDVSKFNTSRITTMEKMFSNCKNLTGLDVSK